jgi:hypothetical protein
MDNPGSLFKPVGIQEIVQARHTLVSHKKSKRKTKVGADNIGKLPIAFMGGKKDHTLAPLKSLIDEMPVLDVDIIIHVLLVYARDKRDLYKVLAECLVGAPGYLSALEETAIRMNRLIYIGAGNGTVPGVKKINKIPQPPA